MPFGNFRLLDGETNLDGEDFLVVYIEICVEFSTYNIRNVQLGKVLSKYYYQNIHASTLN